MKIWLTLSLSLSLSLSLGNQMQKSILAKQMEGHVISLSLQMYGCRVVQKVTKKWCESTGGNLTPCFSIIGFGTCLDRATGQACG
jgi:hypothetical protein